VTHATNLNLSVLKSKSALSLARRSSKPNLIRQKAPHGLIHGRHRKCYQCPNCRHQATHSAGTIIKATKLPLTTWFLAFYLVGQAKTGISFLVAMYHFGVNYRTARLIHNKITTRSVSKKFLFFAVKCTDWRCLILISCLNSAEIMQYWASLKQVLVAPSTPWALKNDNR